MIWLIPGLGGGGSSTDKMEPQALSNKSERVNSCRIDFTCSAFSQGANGDVRGGTGVTHPASITPVTKIVMPFMDVPAYLTLHENVFSLSI